MAVSRRDMLTGAAALPMLGLGSRAVASHAPSDAPADPWNPANWTRSANLAPDMEIDLWPEGALTVPSGLTETVTQRSDDPLASDRVLEHCTRPRLAAFLPEKPNGAAVVIAPGGGYRYSVIDKEGYEIARLLAARGVAAFVLFYRMPNEGWAEGKDAPLADAQRAMRVVRFRSVEFGIDVQRVAMMGFSAGGHLAASLLTRYDATAYAPVSNFDEINARPDAGLLIYPVISMDPAIAHIGSRDRLIGTQPSEADVRTYSPDQMVTADTPPTFLLFAEDDPVVPVENGIQFRAAMKTAGVEIETHLFAKGGHGFGLRRTEGLPVAAWPELLWRWMRARGLV